MCYMNLLPFHEINLQKNAFCYFLENFIRVNRRKNHEGQSIKRKSELQ